VKFWQGIFQKYLFSLFVMFFVLFCPVPLYLLFSGRVESKETREGRLCDIFYVYLLSRRTNERVAVARFRRVSIIHRMHAALSGCQNVVMATRKHQSTNTKSWGTQTPRNNNNASLSSNRPPFHPFRTHEPIFLYPPLGDSAFRPKSFFPVRNKKEGYFIKCSFSFCEIPTSVRTETKCVLRKPELLEWLLGSATDKIQFWGYYKTFSTLLKEQGKWSFTSCPEATGGKKSSKTKNPEKAKSFTATNFSFFIL